MLENTGAGKRLYELRLKQNKTMDEVVVEFNERFGTNIAKASLSRWERGLNEPSLAIAKMMCEYFDVTGDYLLGLGENKNDH